MTKFYTKIIAESDFLIMSQSLNAWMFLFKNIISVDYREAQANQSDFFGEWA